VAFVVLLAMPFSRPFIGVAIRSRPTLRSFPHKLLLLLALIFTLLNAFKPLTIDDTAYHALAAHLAQSPLDPYGYTAFWWDWPEIGNEVLAPPVLPYWWAIGIRLFGENIFLVKMWLLPFTLLFAYALYALAHRFARGMEWPVVAITLFSPTFLPSLNMMLDVPALAIALSALVLFIRACDRNSFILAALAGLVAGLGMETKFTAFLAPAAMLLYAVCLGRIRLWPAAAFLAAQVFLSWELLMALLYRESHFLLHARYGGGNKGELLPLISNLGSVAWPVSLLALAALGVRWRVLVAAGIVGLLAYAAVVSSQGSLQESGPYFKPGRMISPAQFLFGALGFTGLLIGLGVLGRLAWRPGVLQRWRRRKSVSLTQAIAVPRSYRMLAFLLLWLALEVVGFKVLSPFVAIRRIMGVVVVSTLLFAHLASLTCRSLSARRAVWGVAGYSALLGLLVYSVDLIDARAEKRAVEETMRRIREVDDRGTVWFIGHWGFQYYAEREGMRPISAYDAPDESDIPIPPRSAFKKGDWVVLPPWPWSGRRLAGLVHTQDFTADERLTKKQFIVVITDRVPLQTIVNYYSGATAVEYHAGPRLEVEVRRVLEDHNARP